MEVYISGILPMDAFAGLLRDIFADTGFVGLFAVLGWLFGIGMTIGIGYVAMRRFESYDNRLTKITEAYEEIADNIRDQTKSLTDSIDSFDDKLQIVINDAIHFNERMLDKVTTLQQILVSLLSRVNNGKD